MIDTAILLRIVALIQGAIAGAKSIADVARELLDIAFESGVPAGVLMGYLSEKGKQNAEMAADIAEFAKLEVARMQAEQAKDT